LVDAIVLTPEGASWATQLGEHGDEFTDEATKLAVFIAFYFENLFVDVLQTNVDAVASAVSELIRGRDLLLPWDFGRDPHDLFVEMFGSKPRDLDPTESVEFLDRLPQGILQLGELLTGPFGLLRSECSRLQMPSMLGLSIPCSDPGCSALHPVELAAFQSPWLEGADIVDAVEAEERTPLASWRGAFRKLAGSSSRFMDDYDTAMLPSLLGSAFALDELRHL
jgi:hypothetical protein